MHFILGIIVCLLLGFLFWFIGQIITNKVNILEENRLLSNLIKITFGVAVFLITINLVGSITKSFLIGLIVFAIITCLLFWQKNNLKELYVSLKDFLSPINISNFFKQNTDRYFWITFCIINLIYGLTAFSTTKLEHFGEANSHIENVTQIINDIYPPKYSFASTIDLRYHYGSDILAATLSKLSEIHPEYALDILSVIFLNLAFLTVYALTQKFLSSSKANFYLVPLFAFLGWGPIINLFKKINPQEQIPTNFLEKLFYLSQTRLIEAAAWSGNVLNWFFAPPTGLSISSFLIMIYLLYRLYEDKQDKKLIYTAGILLSSFVIFDFSKFVLIIICVVCYLFITFQPTFDDSSNSFNKTSQTQLLKNACILLVISILLGVIYGNYLKLDKYLIPLFNYYKLGTSNLEKNFSPLSSNILLVIFYAFGFYQAYKQKDKWIIFLIPFFALSLVFPLFVTAPNAGVGKIFMISNVVGAFSAPFTTDFLIKKFNINESKLKIFYIAIIIIFGFSSVMFFAFGEREKPIFSVINGSLKYNGFQSFPISIVGDSEKPFISHLNSKFAKNKIIILDSQYADVFTINTGLTALLPFQNLKDIPLRKDAFGQQTDVDHKKLFLVNKKFYKEKKVDWIFLTPRVFRYMFLPQARIKLLNTSFNKGLNLAVSNNYPNDLSLLSELYNINPDLVSKKQNISYSSSLKKFLNNSKNKDAYSYLYQIAECPYWGIYSAKSNDFDGDKIADIAFFDPVLKKWHIIYGSNQEEIVVDLSSTILANSTDEDLFIPIPSDYDGDGKTDIALLNKLKGTWHVLRSSDSQQDARIYNMPWSLPVGEIPTPADVDGDSRTDHSCFDSIKSGAWHSFLSTTNTYQYNGFEFTVNDIPSHIDIDGDKRADYVIYRGGRKMFEVFLSSNSFDPQRRIQVVIGEQNSRIIPADYDGDSKVDLATWTPSNGRWEIAYAKDFVSNVPSLAAVAPQPFIGCGANAQAQGNLAPVPCISHVKTFGKSGDIPIPADYNGDGKADIAVYHPSTAQLKILMPTETSKNIDLSKYKNYVFANFIGL